VNSKASIFLASFRMSRIPTHKADKNCKDREIIWAKAVREISEEAGTKPEGEENSRGKTGMQADKSLSKSMGKNLTAGSEILKSSS
jgi:hypothetical protein